MEANTPHTKASEIIDIRIAKIFKREDGIICVQAKDDVDITLTDSKESYAAVVALAKGEMVAVLSLTGSGNSITEEVQKDWTAKRDNNIVFAEAVVAKSLAHKLIVNFLVNFYDLGRPMKMFTDEARAVQWLRRKIERENKPT